MNKQISLADNVLNTQILEFCRHVAGSAKINAAAQIDSYPAGTANGKTIIEIMVVIDNFPPRIMSYIRTLNQKTIYLFAVDRWIFERDIERGFLGEAIASKLVFPHSALLGDAYLHLKEVILKKRLILELLENLALNFPELASRIQIQPQYFKYEVLLNRVRAFPLLAYGLDLSNESEYREIESLASYNEALSQLEREGQIYFFESYVKMSNKLIMRSQDPRIRFINLSRNAPRALFSSFFGFLPQVMNIASANTEAFLRTQKINWRQLDLTSFSVDPQKYVYFQTSSGLLSLSEKIDIKGFVQKMLLGSPSEDIEVQPIGGLLNDVYLISAHSNEIENKVIAKRFKDWSGFKWFPLTLWSLGARPLAVSGQARLAKECATSEFLRSEGFNVPKILHVSNAERLIFMEYINGENLSQAIKRIASTLKGQTIENELTEIGKAGELMARVHSHNITLGDTKPENMIVTQDGTIYLIDFEQAIRGGDKAWDVAVFLYYSGHYISPIANPDAAELITKAFIQGYLAGGGKKETIKKAWSAQYTKVFSIFTPPQVIFAISNICRKINKLQENEK